MYTYTYTHRHTHTHRVYTCTPLHTHTHTRALATHTSLYVHCTISVLNLVSAESTICSDTITILTWFHRMLGLEAVSAAKHVQHSVLLLQQSVCLHQSDTETEIKSTVVYLNWNMKWVQCIIHCVPFLHLCYFNMQFYDILFAHVGVSTAILLQIRLQYMWHKCTVCSL